MRGLEILQDVPIGDLKEWADNPRKNEKAAEKLTKLIEKYGYIDPIVVDQNNIIRAGHTRLKALKKLGKERVPLVLKVEFESEDEAAGYAIADNKSMEWASWDVEVLDDILQKLQLDGVNLKILGFDKFDKKDNPYTKEVNIPHYEVTGEDVSLDDLVDEKQVSELLAEIEKSNVSDEEKEFLRKAVTRLYVFNYAKIAEYYVQASEEMQRLMEALALVIIDFDDAIARGYVKLTKQLEELRKEDVGV